MARVPRLVVLPRIESCQYPAKVRMNIRDMGNWSDLELLSLTPEVLSHPEILASGTKTAAEIKSAAEAISKGEIPVTEVPRISGTATNPAFYSTLSVLYALAMVGHERLPVIATKTAAPWLKSELGATEAPADWRLEYGND